MSAYDVYLGKATDAVLRGFMVHGGVEQGLDRYLVNPYAQKVGAGDRQYEDNASFDYWTTKDWASGFGKKDPEESFLYGHADTRFPNQALLPMEPTLPGYAQTPNGGTNYREGQIELWPEGDTDPSHITAACNSFRNITWGEIPATWATVKIKAPYGAKVRIGIWTVSGGRYPETLLGEQQVTVITERPVAEYISTTLPHIPLTARTEYALVVSCDQRAELYHVHPTVPPGFGRTIGRIYYGAVNQWSAYDYGFQFGITTKGTQAYLALQDGEDYLNLNLGDPDLGSAGDYFITNVYGLRVLEYAMAGGKMHAAWGSFLEEWDEGSQVWAQVYDSLGPQIQDIIEIDDKIWIALGINGYVVYDPKDSSTQSFAEPVSLWHLHKGYGYLYRAFDNNIWYTNDGSTWVGPHEVCRQPYAVRGLCSMGEYVYMACDDRLFYLGPGDFVHQVSRWPSIDSRNGRGMVEWMGNLFIPLAEDIVQYSEAGVMLQMGLRVGEGLPVDMQGDVYQLLSTNYFLLAIVDPQPGDGAPSVWAYGSDGWHNICRLPQGIGAGAIYLDTETNWLWIGSGNGVSFRAMYPPAVINPVRDFSGLVFCREGWIEFDEFDGRLAELLKDGESVYVNGEYLGPDSKVSIYWKEEEDEDWRLLGDVTSNHEFVRWDDYTERPEFRTIRLGFALRTDLQHSSPILRAHMLKYLAISADRYGWQARLIISDYDEDLAGDIQETQEDRDEKRAFLSELERSVHPVIFRDIDDVQYEVRITASARRIERYERTADGNRRYDSVHPITMEQVTDTPSPFVVPTE